MNKCASAIPGYTYTITGIYTCSQTGQKQNPVWSSFTMLGCLCLKQKTFQFSHHLLYYFNITGMCGKHLHFQQRDNSCIITKIIPVFVRRQHFGCSPIPYQRERHCPYSTQTIHFLTKSSKCSTDNNFDLFHWCYCPPPPLEMLARGRTSSIISSKSQEYETNNMFSQWGVRISVFERAISSVQTAPSPHFLSRGQETHGPAAWTRQTCTGFSGAQTRQKLPP